MTNGEAPKRPLPESNALTQPFWDASKVYCRTVRRCKDCDRLVWYPRARCPHCGGTDLRWAVQSGRGRLFSWAVVEKPLFAPFADRVPYVTGLVALEEDPGVRLVTNIVGCEPRDLRMEMPVRVLFQQIEFEGSPGRVVAPMFEPDPVQRPSPPEGHRRRDA